MWTLTSSPRSAWIKRVNPSSGGLHPIEAYVILPAKLHDLPPDLEGSDLEGGVYHYAARHHGLERRHVINRSKDVIEGSDDMAWRDLGLGSTEFMIGISSIHWREVWKYGERGFRYSLLDSGHAYGSLAISAARLGWRITLLPDLETRVVEDLLGLTDSNRFLPSGEKERGLVLGVVSTSGKNISLRKISEVQEMIRKSAEEKRSRMKWEGFPNVLSSTHKMWDIVEKVDNATIVTEMEKESISKSMETKTRPRNQFPFSDSNSKIGIEDLCKLSENKSLESVILSRRSALDYVNKPISLDQFVHILYSVIQSDATLNFAWPPLATLFIFAYHVDGLHPGLYVLIRNESELDSLKRETAANNFAWAVPESIPSLPIYFLKEMPKEEICKLSYVASCNQNIARQGGFSLGMFVNVEKGMEEMGPAGYCRAHMECGAVGQVLYLEAHAVDLGATGMGCFLDDVARSSFGLEGSPYWPLYHFAVGVPSKDIRYEAFDYSTKMFAGVLDECVAFMRK